ncbi:MAG: preprotein translocase subunit SecF [Saprospiraceae bacterium]|jgi:preprotein translocase subunit SecF
MHIFNKATNIDFLGKRKQALFISIALILISIAALAIRGLNFGVDFTGGTLVEVGYDQAVEVEMVRTNLENAEFEDAIVQHFGTSKDVLIRLPSTDTKDAVSLSAKIVETLRAGNGEVLSPNIEGVNGIQQCIKNATTADCSIQMRRVEFVGPQVGEELANQGGLAMLYALFGILVYVAFRFRWQFSVGSVVALVHDVMITLGAFALFQFEFTLSVLAAVLAVIGYSLNDTIVVFDRIRENFRKKRKGDRVFVINSAINDTLPRTILTSVTTMLVVLTLLLFGGEVLRGFSIALALGVLIGTYSSIFVASPSVLALGIQREHMMPAEKEEDDIKALV